MNKLSGLYDFSVKLFPWIVLGCTLLVYILIFSQLNLGTSCDEGYYLQGYLQNQPLGSGVSQFHYIVRQLFFFLPEDNALSLRYVRFILNVAALFVFAFTSYKWLQLKISKVLYCSFIFLGGAMAFTFASPVLYYDNIQLIIFLFAFSILFSYSYPSIILKRVLSVFLGGLLVFALLNYLSSGILLILLVICWFVFVKPQERLINTLFIFAGVLAGALFYHLFIHDLFLTIKDIYISFVVAQAGKTSHDSSSLMMSLIKYISRLILIFAGTTLVSIGVLYLSKFIYRNKILKILILGIAGVLLVALMIYRNLYTTFRSDLYVIPLAILFAVIIKNKRINLKSCESYQKLIVFLMLLVVPVAGIFGTNQSLSAKAIFFMPFWIVALFFLSASFYIKTKGVLPSLLLYICLFFAGYVHLGFFTRYHYYYTPKRSNVLLENTERFKGISVAPQQKEFIEKVNLLLKENGFKKNDEILAFEVDLITVYAVGGLVPNAMFYGNYNIYIYYKIPPQEKIKYIMMYSEREKEFTDYLKKANWGFPEKYKRYDLGKYAQNMYDSENSILFIANN